jgi:dihydroorotate dehydrogenase
MDAEKAHRLAIRALALGLVPAPCLPATTPVDIGGVHLPNRVGIAAGFDKNAEAIAPLFKQGFGMVEVGTITPRPQEGNPKPRLFRLKEDQAVINRMGFNNEGIEAARARIVRYRERYGHTQGALGINIGKNKDTANERAGEDYLAGLNAFYPLADYITINISSPNTAGLRALQEREALEGLLAQLAGRRAQLAQQTGRKVPLWLKVAPDLTGEDIAVIADTAVAQGMDALIVSNTTIARPTLHSPHAGEQGGLSGAPLMPPSTEILRQFATHLQGALPLIGVGGIVSPEDAKAKLAAGASAVQLYSALVYQGFGLARRIREALNETVA